MGLMGEKVIGVDLRTTGGAWSVNDTIPGAYEKGIPEVMGDVAVTIDVGDPAERPAGKPGRERPTNTAISPGR